MSGGVGESEDGLIVGAGRRAGGSGLATESE